MASNFFPRIAVAVQGVSRLKQKLASIPKMLMGPLVVKRIEKVLLNRTKRRFITKTDPRGIPWAPLSQARWERRARERKRQGFKQTPFAIAHNGILVFTGQLADSIKIYRAGNRQGFAVRTGAGFRIGTEHPSARRHHYGDPKKNLPARKFLGITRRDSTAIERLMLRVAKQAGLR